MERRLSIGNMGYRMEVLYSKLSPCLKSPIIIRHNISCMCIALCTCTVYVQLYLVKGHNKSQAIARVIHGLNLNVALMPCLTI